jgi:hypothetical protein
MLLIAILAEVPLLRVTGNERPLEPAYILPKVRLEGLAVTVAAVPNPESDTF